MSTGPHSAQTYLSKDEIDLETRLLTQEYYERFGIQREEGAKATKIAESMINLKLFNFDLKNIVFVSLKGPPMATFFKNTVSPF